MAFPVWPLYSSSVPTTNSSKELVKTMVTHLPPTNYRQVSKSSVCSVAGTMMENLRVLASSPSKTEE